MRRTRKRKKRLSTVLITVLVVTGLGVLFYPTISNLYTQHQLREEIRQYNRVLEAEQADYSALWEEAEAYNRTVAQKENHLATDEAERTLVYDLLNPNDSNMLGYIEIPAIDVELPIYRGTEEKQLQSGAGWWIGSSLPTGGESTHCIITAHTGLAKAKMFTDLDQLKEGDRFTITVLDRTLTYQVDQILVTEPEDVDPLEIVRGKDYVTLYTCTPYGVNSHRLLVRGVRIQSEETSAVQSNLLQESSAEGIDIPWQVLLAIPAIGLIVLAALIIRGITRRGKHELDKKAGTRRRFKK